MERICKQCNGNRIGNLLAEAVGDVRGLQGDGPSIAFYSRYGINSYEEEIRYIVKSFDADKFHYFFKNGKLRKCYEFNMNKDALTKIYVGSNNSDAIIEEIGNYMSIIGLRNVAVEKIDLPYRSR